MLAGLPPVPCQKLAQNNVTLCFIHQSTISAITYALHFKDNFLSSNKCSLCYLGIMQQTNGVRIFEIYPVGFMFICYEHTKHTNLYNINLD